MPSESETATSKQKEKTHASRKSKLWEILNSQFVLWILGSVVLAGITGYWNYRNDNRLELEKEHQKALNDQRDDSQFLATLLPYLTHSELDVRIRACDVINARYAGQKMPADIQRLEGKVLTEIGRMGLNNQSDETKRLVENVVRGLDQQQTPDPTVSTAIQQLPARVYLQIFDESQRAKAKEIQSALQKSYLVLGIENVFNKGPQPSQTTEVRYFNDSDSETAEQVKRVLSESHVKDPTTKHATGKAKPGTIEIWFPMPSQPNNRSRLLEHQVTTRS